MLIVNLYFRRLVILLFTSFTIFTPLLAAESPFRFSEVRHIEVKNFPINIQDRSLISKYLNPSKLMSILKNSRSDIFENVLCEELHRRDKQTYPSSKKCPQLLLKKQEAVVGINLSKAGNNSVIEIKVSSKRDSLMAQTLADDYSTRLVKELTNEEVKYFSLVENELHRKMQLLKAEHKKIRSEIQSFLPELFGKDKKLRALHNKKIAEQKKLDNLFPTIRLVSEEVAYSKKAKSWVGGTAFDKIITEVIREKKYASRVKEFLMDDLHNLKRPLREYIQLLRKGKKEVIQHLTQNVSKFPEFATLKAQLEKHNPNFESGNSDFEKLILLFLIRKECLFIQKFIGKMLNVINTQLHDEYWNVNMQRASYRNDVNRREQDVTSDIAVLKEFLEGTTRVRFRLIDEPKL